MAPTTKAHRFVDSQGRTLIGREGFEAHWFRDTYHYLLVTSWPRFFAVLVACYLSTNLLFGFAYFVDPGGLANTRPGSFAEGFFFSVQTLATIGYGHVYPQSVYCHLVVLLETVTGVVGFAIMTGLVFAKFARASARVMFSRVAVITPRDGVPSLMFRMANERANQIVDASLHVVLARTETTIEGERVRRLYDLNLLRKRTALFTLSWTAVHPIDDRSPLLGQTPQSMRESQTEIIVSLVGLDESFGQTIHARCAYATDDILWGHHFVDLFYDNEHGHRVMNLRNLHRTYSASVTDPQQTP